jgi:hypothetical protein
LSFFFLLTTDPSFVQQVGCNIPPLLMLCCLKEFLFLKIDTVTQERV